MMSTTAGVRMPETEVLTMKNDPMPSPTPRGAVEMVMMGFSDFRTLGPWDFCDFRDARSLFQPFLFKYEWTSIAIIALPPGPAPHFPSPLGLPTF